MNNMGWADLHLGHLAAAKSRGFEDLKTYHECISDAWVKNVTPRTTIIIVGDAALTNEGLLVIKKLPAYKKILVLGNHDKERQNDIRDILEVFDDVEGYWRHPRMPINFSHCPAHPSELRGRLNVHGHKHKEVIRDKRYVNVCWDLLPDGPVDLERVISGEWRSWHE